MGDSTALDQEEQRVRIDRMIAERSKFLEEEAKLRREAAKLERDRSLAPWQIVVTAMGAGAALFAAGAAFVKIFLT